MSIILLYNSLVCVNYFFTTLDSDNLFLALLLITKTFT